MSRNLSVQINTGSGGTGFVGALTISFVVLRLCNVIDWSWLWVLSPMWISVAVSVAILFVVLVVWASVWMGRRL